MATGTTVFSRVTVVAPNTRIDVALPADVSVADLMPMLLEMSRERGADGGAHHGGWVLAQLGREQLDPGRTLASLGIVDGDLLQLRRGSDNPPPPLYDDVVDAISDSDPDSFRPWTDETSKRFGHITGSLALIGSAVALLLGGSFDGGGNLAPAIAGGVAAIFAVAIGAVIARVYGAVDTGVVIAAAGALPMAFVSGLYIVPGTPGRASLLLAFVMALVFATASLLLVGSGITVLISGVTLAALGTLAMLFAVLISGHPAEGIAAGTAAVSLMALSVLPRFTIQLAKLPLPQVPGSVEDLKEEQSLPDYEVIEQRAGLAHSYMTGMMIGAGVAAAIASIVAARSAGVSGPILCAVVAVVLMMRGRSYANGAQAAALLVCGMIAAGGLLAGWLWVSDVNGRLLWVFGTLLILGVAGLVLGVAIPKQRFSPITRRTVDLLEAALIAAVLPVALAVMDLYTTFRNLIS